MIYLIIGIIFIYSPPSWTLSVKRIGSDSLFMEAKTCDEIDNEVKQLMIWTNKSENRSCKKPLNTVLENSTCYADISECVPEHVKKYHDTNPKSYGPNCYNLALVMSGILPSLRHSTSEEISYYMQPPLCSQLSSDEIKIPGDIGLIRFSNKDEVHAFIHISDKLVYSKNGVDTDSPFSIQKAENVNNKYINNNIKTCQEIQKKKPSPRKCEIDTEYYRCISMEEYLSNNSDHNIENLKNDLLELNKTECQLSSAVSKNNTFNSEQKKNILDTVQALNHYLNSEVKKNNENPSKDPKVSFLLGALKMRLFSIKHQLYYLYYKIPDPENKVFINRLEKAVEAARKELSSEDWKNR